MLWLLGENLFVEIFRLRKLAGLVVLNGELKGLFNREFGHYRSGIKNVGRSLPMNATFGDKRIRCCEGEAGGVHEGGLLHAVAEGWAEVSEAREIVG